MGKLFIEGHVCDPPKTLPNDANTNLLIKYLCDCGVLYALREYRRLEDENEPLRNLVWRVYTPSPYQINTDDSPISERPLSKELYNEG